MGQARPVVSDKNAARERYWDAVIARARRIDPDAWARGVSVPAIRKELVRRAAEELAREGVREPET